MFNFLYLNIKLFFEYFIFFFFFFDNINYFFEYKIDVINVMRNNNRFQKNNIWLR